MDLPVDRPRRQPKDQVMRPDGTVDGLKPADVAAYWRDVTKILRTVLERRDAAALVGEFRKRLDRAPAATRTIFYHASPLHTAADLAGVEGPLTEAQISQAPAIQGVGLGEA